MNSRNQIIRALLAEMGPARVESYVSAFDLYEEEALFIIEREAHKKSVSEIARENHVSIETVKRRRRSGFTKIAEQLDTFETL